MNSIQETLQDINSVRAWFEENKDKLNYGEIEKDWSTEEYVGQAKKVFGRLLKYNELTQGNALLGCFLNLNSIEAQYLLSIGYRFDPETDTQVIKRIWYNITMDMYIDEFLEHIIPRFVEAGLDPSLKLGSSYKGMEEMTWREFALTKSDNKEFFRTFL